MVTFQSPNLFGSLETFHYICYMGKTTVEKARESRRKHYRKNKEAYIERAKAKKALIKEYVTSVKQKCSICDETEKACLEFHHLGNKEGIINKMVNCGSLDKIKKEIDKCVVLCSNCHRKLHAGIITYPAA